MFAKIKSLFVDRCPSCSEPLISSKDHLRVIKSCPNDHYTEEIYTHLHVRIVYHK